MDEPEYLSPLDAILLGAESGARLAVIGIVNAAKSPLEDRIEALERENESLRAEIARLTEDPTPPGSDSMKEN